MGITIFKRHVYDDVTLFASTNLEASQWTLEVARDEHSMFQPVAANIKDSNLNWSTPDLSLWEGLYRGDATAIGLAFPDTTKAAQAGIPFAVMWNVSNWVDGTVKCRFRFTDPSGSTHEFQRDWGRPELHFG